MKISLDVPEREYRALESVADRRGQAVPEVARELISEFVSQQQGSGRSVLDIPPHPGGKPLRGWERDEIFDEMIQRHGG